MTQLFASTQIDALLAWAFGALFAVFAARSAIGGLLAALGALPGRFGDSCHQLSLIVTPRLVRRLAVAAVALVSATAVVTPAQAADGRGAAQIRIDRGTAQQRPDSVDMPHRHTTVTVNDDDCLWSLAADQLGPNATEHDIDRQWRRWYRLNRQTIGHDPNIIVTGATLLVPAVTR
jgi:hypothetical protein